MRNSKLKKSRLTFSFAILFILIFSLIQTQAQNFTHKKFFLTFNELMPNFFNYQNSSKDTNSKISTKSNKEKTDKKKNSLYAGTENIYLNNFFEKLDSYENGQISKIKIIHFGDSFLWGDNLSKTLAENFQNKFGDGGRGFISPVETLASKLTGFKKYINRNNFSFNEIHHKFGRKGNRKNYPDPNPYLGFKGEFSQPKNKYSYIRLKNLPNRSSWNQLDIYLHPSPKSKQSYSTYNIQIKTSKGKTIEKTIRAAKNQVTLDSTFIDGADDITITFKGNNTYPLIDTLSVETKEGFVYNTVIRMGTHMTWMKVIDNNILSTGLKAASPDLLIYQFGINEATSLHYIETFNSDMYKRDLREWFKKIRSILPNTDILVIGSPERMLVKNGKVLPFEESLLVRNIQKEVCSEMNIAYFDSYEFLGGKGHMSKLVKQRLALKDHTHFSNKGCINFANDIYNILNNEYYSYSTQKHLKKEEPRTEYFSKTLSAIQDNNQNNSGDSAIIFNSKSYFYFFLIVIIAAAILSKYPTLRLAFLTLASYYFYATWKIWAVSLLLISTIIDYTAARLIGKSQRNNKNGTIYLIFSLLSNLGMLTVFKYFDFFAEITNSLTAATPFKTSVPMLKLILPVGISFYTFQTLSYTIDIYRGKIKPEKNFLKFALYVSFFPQLVAGPIVRASQFVPEITDKARHFFVNNRHFSNAVFLILTGLTKKMTADWIAVNLVDDVFMSPSMYSTPETLIAIYGYALQIYGDFSGYTDIAIGSALLLGFNLTENFNRPYKSVSISDFWRRWHISLGSWFRDYLYIPLGGNRKRVYFNLIFVFFMTGLWHGAGIPFVLWGLYNGILLIFERLTGLNQHKMKFSLTKALRIFITFHVVLFGWIIFRSSTFDQFKGIINSLTSGSFTTANITLSGIIVLVLCYLVHFSPIILKDKIKYHWGNMPSLLQGLTISISFVFLYNISITEAKPFIYFQF